MTMLSADVRDHVSSAVYTSLLRIAGGGYNNVHAPSSSEQINEDNHIVCNTEEWVNELERISLASVSFPNGNNNKNTTDDNCLDGTPHDVEVRAAPSLFHYVAAKNKKKEKGKRKRKKRTMHNDDESNDHNVCIELISDYGTKRSVVSAQSLANLLTIELEKELISNNTNRNMHHEKNTSSAKELNETTTSFTHIKPNKSGIICLISNQRSQQLYTADRLPCPHCINWYKGTKGLWWHILNMHVREYSQATQSAENEVNTMAIVPYQVTNALPILPTKEAHQTDKEPNNNIQSSDYTVANETNAFDMVKKGQYNDLKNVIEQGKFDPTNTFDKNGSSILHWSAGCGQLDITKYLIENCNCCANVGQRGKRSFGGRTPLHW